jgi:hypothetical protein
MNYNNNMGFVALLSLMLALVACTKIEKIENFPIEEPRLVVNALFTKGEPFYFHVSRSLSVLDNAPLKPISDATIILYRDQLAVDTLKQGYDGYYFSAIAPEQNKGYSIKVFHPRYDTIQSVVEMLPEPVVIKGLTKTVIDSVAYVYQYYDNSGRVDTIINTFIFDCVITLQDHPSPGSVYGVAVVKYDSTYWHYEGNYWVKTNPPVMSEDPALVADSRVGYSGVYSTQLYFSDDLFNGQEYRFKFTVEDYGWTTKWRKYYVIVYNFTPSSYFYARSRGESPDFYSPFDEPSRIFSNIQRGYGIFAGYERTEYELP